MIGAVPPCEEVIERSASDQDKLGIPPIVKYHGGWKKWKVDIGGNQHTFSDKEAALDAAAWVQVWEIKLDQTKMAQLNAELKEAGQKTTRSKKDSMMAVLRHRYKSASMGCTCCFSAKARPCCIMLSPSRFLITPCSLDILHLVSFTMFTFTICAHKLVYCA